MAKKDKQQVGLFQTALVSGDGSYNGEYDQRQSAFNDPLSTTTLVSLLDNRRFLDGSKKYEKDGWTRVYAADEEASLKKVAKHLVERTLQQFNDRFLDDVNTVSSEEKRIEPHSAKQITSQVLKSLKGTKLSTITVGDFDKRLGQYLALSKEEAKQVTPAQFKDLIVSGKAPQITPVVKKAAPAPKSVVKEKVANTVPDLNDSMSLKDAITHIKDRNDLRFSKNSFRDAPTILAEYLVQEGSKRKAVKLSKSDQQEAVTTVTLALNEALKIDKQNTGSVLSDLKYEDLNLSALIGRVGFELEEATKAKSVKNLFGYKSLNTNKLTHNFSDTREHPGALRQMLDATSNFTGYTLKVSSKLNNIVNSSTPKEEAIAIVKHYKAALQNVVPEKNGQYYDTAMDLLNRTAKAIEQAPSLDASNTQLGLTKLQEAVSYCIEVQYGLSKGDKQTKEAGLKTNLDAVDTFIATLKAPKQAEVLKSSQEKSPEGRKPSTRVLSEEHEKGWAVIAKPSDELATPSAEALKQSTKEAALETFNKQFEAEKKAEEALKKSQETKASEASPLTFLKEQEKEGLDKIGSLMDQLASRPNPDKKKANTLPRELTQEDKEFLAELNTASESLRVTKKELAKKTAAQDLFKEKEELDRLTKELKEAKTKKKIAALDTILADLNAPLPPATSDLDILQKSLDEALHIKALSEKARAEGHVKEATLKKANPLVSAHNPAPLKQTAAIVSPGAIDATTSNAIAKEKITLQVMEEYGFTEFSQAAERVNSFLDAKAKVPGLSFKAVMDQEKALTELVASGRAPAATDSLKKELGSSYKEGRSNFDYALLLTAKATFVEQNKAAFDKVEAKKIMADFTEKNQVVTQVKGLAKSLNDVEQLQKIKSTLTEATSLSASAKEVGAKGDNNALKTSTQKATATKEELQNVEHGKGSVGRKSKLWEQLIKEEAAAAKASREKGDLPGRK